jgi:hypothetical protein
MTWVWKFIYYLTHYRRTKRYVSTLPDTFKRKYTTIAEKSFRPTAVGITRGYQFGNFIPEDFFESLRLIIIVCFVRRFLLIVKGWMNFKASAHQTQDRSAVWLRTHASLFVINKSFSYRYPTKWDRYNMFFVIRIRQLFYDRPPAWRQPSLKPE